MPKVGCEERWRALVGDRSRSGEPVREFCAARGLSRWTFYEWQRRLRRSEAPGAGHKAEFLPVRVVDSAVPEAAGRSSGVEVRLRGNRRLRLERGFDPAVLASAVAVLEGGTC